MGAAKPRVRLFVEDDLSAGCTVGLSPPQSHYVANVMRYGRGDRVALFNGRDGEWQARIDGVGRGWCSVAVADCLRPFASGPDLWLVMAPVKRAPLDFTAAKATELGVSAVWPVFTRRTAVSRINQNRLRANLIEAAEQCGRLDVPTIREPASLDRVLADWPGERRILLCDETGAGIPIAEALQDAPNGPWAVLTGPEGGFARDELDALAKLPFAVSVGLGPRILRAETAALAALACWQAWLGDWRADRPANADSATSVSRNFGSNKN